MLGGDSVPFFKEPNILTVGRLGGPGDELFTFLYVVISAGWFLQHEHPPIPLPPGFSEERLELN